ncbi:MAG: alpha/beta fold hydrolase [Selenomonadaceae bacterium]|nr:alpha/beta fold hydrolase [Selenomonadaceae bacterium]
MNKKFFKNAVLTLALAAGIFSANVVDAKPITLETQGSYAIGGTTIQHDGTFSTKNFLSPEGQKAYGDHAYVFYQIPVNAKKYPIIFQHGGAQSKRTWESTPDGREGFQNIFLRKGYGVYLVDQPRIGEAGLSTQAASDANPWAGNPLYADKTLFMLSRVGLYDGDTPRVFDNAAFPKDAASIDQFQRSWTNYTGELDNDLNADVLAKLFDKVGPSILAAHSMGGTIAWRTTFRTDNVKAIVAFEPGGTPFVFPEGEVPEAEKATFEMLGASAMAVPLKDFMKLTKIPIVLYYGDNIKKSSELVGPDKWYTELDMAKKFVATINRHGGDATLVELPKVGLKGNTHFLMGDLNNKELADLVEQWLKSKGLDK